MSASSSASCMGSVACWLSNVTNACVPVAVVALGGLREGGLSATVRSEEDVTAVSWDTTLLLASCLPGRPGADAPMMGAPTATPCTRDAAVAASRCTPHALPILLAAESAQAPAVPRVRCKRAVCAP